MGEREPKGQLESGNGKDGSPLHSGQVDETHERNWYLLIITLAELHGYRGSTFRTIL